MTCHPQRSHRPSIDGGSGVSRLLFLLGIVTPIALRRLAHDALSGQTGAGWSRRSASSRLAADSGLKMPNSGACWLVWSAVAVILFCSLSAARNYAAVQPACSSMAGRRAECVARLVAGQRARDTGAQAGVGVATSRAKRTRL